MELLKRTLEGIKPANEENMKAAQERLDGLLKPPGSLGKLEDIAKQLAGIYGVDLPQKEEKAIIMMVADNGVYEEGYHEYPQDITLALAELAGPGLIGVSVLAKHAGARLCVVDVGINGDVAGEHIINRKIRKGTSNIAKGPAMTREEAVKAIGIGIEITNALIDEGIGVIGTGEAGLCNTTTSAAVISALTGEKPEATVGIGTGVQSEAMQKKLQAVKNALAINKPDSKDVIDVVAKVGGFDIAAMMGCYLAAASRKKPIVIDGFIAGAAALAAIRLCPQVKDYMIPSHLSAEKGVQILFKHLGMEPMLLMNMRLGEGTGAALAFNLIDTACSIINNMGSFADLG